MSTALDLSTLLVTAGLGVAGTNLFVNVLPPLPTVCVGLFDIPSEPIAYAHGATPVNQRRLVQLQARNVDPALAVSKVQACLDVLRNVGFSANGRTYEMLRPRTAAAILGRDDNNYTVAYGELECWIDLG